MLEWFRSRFGKPQEIKHENLALPLLEDRPVAKMVYPTFLKPKLVASSVILKLGFCEGCNPADPKLLCVNHTAKLFDCEKKECHDKLVKIDNA